MAQPIKASVVVEVVAEWFDVSVGDLLGPRRSRTYVNARHVAMHLLRKHTSMSLPEIGDLLNKDHSTVLIACRRVEQMLEKASWQVDYDEIKRTIMDQSFADSA